MNKLFLASVVALLVAPGALAQSFNGAGRMNPSSPTGWSPNPMTQLNTGKGLPYNGNPYMNPYNINGYYPGGGIYNPGGVYNPGGGVVYPFGMPYVAPVAMGNGLFSFNGGGVRANLWRAPSGYYYPWGMGANPYNQIIYINNTGGQQQTVAQQPPLSMQFSDMNQFLDDAQKKGKINDADYRSMKQRLKDIQAKERSYRIAGDGFLEEGYDNEIRNDLKDFSKLMTERIKL